MDTILTHNNVLTGIEIPCNKTIKPKQGTRLLLP